MRVIDFFDRGLELNPDAPCLSDIGQPAKSFLEVSQATHAIAAALLSMGVTTASKVAIYSPNLAAAFECVLGIFRAAAVWVPVNARNALAENCYVMDNTDVEILIVHSSFFADLPTIRRLCPKLRHVIGLDAQVARGEPNVPQWLAQPAHGSVDRTAGPSDVVSIFSSGGTTGKPKGVTWSNLTWSAMVANFQSSMPCDRPPVHLVVAPMTHGAGAVAICLLGAGAHQVIMKSFDALQVLEAIERHQVTHLFLPPTAIYMLLSHPSVREYNYSSLRYFIYAAAPMSVDKLREALEIFGPVMAQTYGQAEAPMIATFFSPADHLAAINDSPGRLLSCGRPALLSPVDVLDDKGNVVPRGVRGEIGIRGNLVMQGYYKNEEATAETRAGSWHLTGDIGYRDQDGFLYIVDRKRDMIITGGFNVYPSEVEQVIWGHPAVQDCAVIGTPDEKWGEAVTALIELRTGMSMTEEEIAALCRDRLGPVKTPKRIEFRQTLPRSAVGKVLKRALRDEYWQGRSRMI